MAVPTMRLSRSQLDDLAAVSAVGPERLRKIADAINAQPLTIKSGKLQELIAGELGHDAAEPVGRALIGLATAIRRGAADISDLLESVSDTLRASWPEQEIRKWHECLPSMERLLNTKSILLSAKALDLAFDFPNLFFDARVLTDIRPVFDDVREEIVGSTITQTLRLDYFSPTGDQDSISIALDLLDIEQLRKACVEAIRKGDIARNLIEEKCGLEATRPGEEYE